MAAENLSFNLIGHKTSLKRNVHPSLKNEQTEWKFTIEKY